MDRIPGEGMKTIQGSHADQRTDNPDITHRESSVYLQHDDQQTDQQCGKSPQGFEKNVQRNVDQTVIGHQDKVSRTTAKQEENHTRQ